jgi:WD40 repeat protein
MRHFVFLSHAGVDNEAALDLAILIEGSEVARHHGLKVWIDRRDLIPGRRWKDALQEAMKHSTAFIVYVGSKGVTNWVWDEVSVALDMAHADPSYPLIPVLGAGVSAKDLPGFLAQYQCIQSPRAPEELTELLRGIVRVEARAKLAVICHPFVGLRSYDVRRTHLFFGRAREVNDLLGLLREEHLVMVVGDSGPGKSSLVRAGVMPGFMGGRLSDGGRDGPDDTEWYTVETRPGLDPFSRLADDLRDAALRAGLGARDASDVAEMVRQTELHSQSLSRSSDRIRDALLSSCRSDSSRPCKVLLVVDQFEEVATAPEAKQYASILVSLADPTDDRIRVVLTMRRDYYYLCASFEKLFDRLESNERRARYLLDRMSSQDVRECIVRPLLLAGVDDRAATDLATAVLMDVGGQAGETALLQMALWRTWSIRTEHNGNLISAYGAIGRVEGALAQAAHEVFCNLSKEDQLRAEVLFVRLVSPGESGSVVRRVARMDEFDRETQVLARFLAEEEQARLVTLGEQTIEIAHEQLATQWLRYQQWIRNAPGDRRGDDLRVLSVLIQDCSNWTLATDQEKSKHLARGYHLDLYHDLARRRRVWLSGSEHEFVKASWQLDADENDRRRRTARKLRLLTLGSTLTALAAVASLAVGLNLWTLRDKARGATLGTAAQTLLVQPVTERTAPLIAALAATGWRLARTSDAWNGLQRVPVLRKIRDLQLFDIDEPSQMLANSDATNAVTINSSGKASIWSIKGKPFQMVSLNAEHPIVRLAVSPDGGTVATASERNVTSLWRMSDGVERSQFPQQTEILDLAFSGDSKILAASTKSGPIQIWDVDKGSLRAVVPQRSTDVKQVAVSKNGQFVATIDVNRTAEIISVIDNRLVECPAVAGHTVSDIAFSADGEFLTVLEGNGTTLLLHVTGCEVMARLPYSGPSAISMALSPDGRFVAFVAGEFKEEYSDFEVRIASIPDGQEVRLHAYGGGPLVRFSANGEALVLNYHEQSGGGTESFAEFWKFELGGREDAMLVYAGPIAAMVPNGNGTLLTIGSHDGTARLISLADKREIAHFSHGGTLTSVAMSPDGTILATVGVDNLVRIWNARDSRELLSLHIEHSIRAVAFTTNNSLATLSDDGVLQRRDIRNATSIARVQVAEDCLAAAFSAGGDWFVCINFNGIVWVRQTANPTEGSNEFDFPGEGYNSDDNPVTEVAISADGKLVASSEEKGPVVIFRASGGAQLARLSDRPATSLQFGSASNLLAYSTEDGSVRLVDANLREIARIGQGTFSKSIAVSNMGFLVTSDAMGRVRFWNTNLDHMVDRLCKATGTNLSRNDWAGAGYLNDLSWRPTCDTWGDE